MKKFLRLFLCITLIASVSDAFAAVTVKKAAPVTSQSSSTPATTASLAGTVLNLVSSVQQLSAKQKALSAECVPSSQEITFVNNTMKEWAKVGEMTAEDAQKRLNRRPCSIARGGYAQAVRIAAGTDAADICYDYFAGDGNADMVWEGFPMASTATYCSDGSLSCKNPVDVSDIYEIFNLIDFSAADYTKTEATMAAKLLSRMENCSYAKLSAKKRAMWGDFLISTVGNMGQSTNTDAIMQSVSGVASGGGIGGLSSLGAIVQQFSNK